MTVRVGLVGLGNMGSVVAARLLSAGFPLWVFNRTRERARVALESGAHWAESPAAVAEQVDVVLVMVADDAALHEVMLGESGIVAAGRAGLIVADMSTVSLTASMTVATAADARGLRFLRAPVTGSTTTAAAGELCVLCSGPRDALEACLEIFDSFASQLFHLGDEEEARVMKLAINTLVATTIVGLSEALVFGKQSGLDWHLMLDVFAASAVASPLLKYKAGPLAARDFAAAFTTSMMTKDLDLALVQAEAAGASMPLTRLSRSELQEVSAMGLADADFSAAVVLAERRARANGVHLNDMKTKGVEE